MPAQMYEQQVRLMMQNLQTQHNYAASQQQQQQKMQQMQMQMQPQKTSRFIQSQMNEKALNIDSYVTSTTRV